MNNKLQKVVSLIEVGITDENILKPAIVDYISDDKSILPMMLSILEAERNTKQ